MNTEQILMCVVALILGMLLANMLKSVCGCKVVEGCEPVNKEFASHGTPPLSQVCSNQSGNMNGCINVATPGSDYSCQYNLDKLIIKSQEEYENLPPGLKVVFPR